MFETGACQSIERCVSLSQWQNVYQGKSGAYGREHF